MAKILDKLYLVGLNGQSKFSYANFKNTLAVSCVRTLAEDLANSQTTFASQMNYLWAALLNKNHYMSTSFDNYFLPFECYLGVIFGGVYYVLAEQQSVSEDHLNMMNTFVTSIKEASPYFDFFVGSVDKNKAKNNLEDMASLRKRFIQNLNNNPEAINEVNWADATIAFDKNVMTELFWGIEDDKVLKSVCNAIISTWYKLVQKKDHRCFADSPVDLAGMKFGGIFNETIEDFFNPLWVKRNAKNEYRSYREGNKKQGELTVPETQATQERKEVIMLPAPQQDLSKELTEALETIESLKNDLEAFKIREKDGRESFMFSVKQMAIIMKAILLNHHSLTNNSKNLAPLLQRFGGWKEKYAETALGHAVTQQECDELGALFEPFAPAIGTIIRQYPTAFTEMKKEKLKNNLRKSG
jgi:hypothetical protein